MSPEAEVHYQKLYPVKCDSCYYRYNAPFSKNALPPLGKKLRCPICGKMTARRIPAVIPFQFAF